MLFTVYLMCFVRKMIFPQKNTLHRFIRIFGYSEPSSGNNSRLISRHRTGIVKYIMLDLNETRTPRQIVLKKQPRFHQMGHLPTALLPPQKLILLLDKTSFLVFSPTNKVPKLHIQLSSFLFRCLTSSTLSTKVTWSLLIASSMSPLWCRPKWLVSPHAVIFLVDPT